MGAVFFYHLTQRPVGETLAMLLHKTQANGWRALVRGSDPQRLAALDDQLWQGPPDSFLAHGLATGEAGDADQPVLLTTQPGNPNGAKCLMAVDGASVSATEAENFARVCILFDGFDPAAVDEARSQWRSLTAAGLAAKYWSEESGRWEMKAESGGAG